jgi:hypothetical protein
MGFEVDSRSEERAQSCRTQNTVTSQRQSEACSSEKRNKWHDRFGLAHGLQLAQLKGYFARGKERCQKWKAPILDAPERRRDDFVRPIL